MYNKFFKMAVAIILAGFLGLTNVFAMPNSNAMLSFSGFPLENNSPNWENNGICENSGNSCNMAIIADAQVSLHPTITNAYIVEIEFQEISSTYNGDSTTTYVHNVNGFTLPDNFKLEITSCHDFPVVEGVIIDLSGKTLNEHGYVTVQIIRE